MKINIVMVEPEIPQNTGNIARTCAATGAKLHLVKPLGFSIDDKHLKRAGLDYWDRLDIEVHENLDEFLKKYGTCISTEKNEELKVQNAKHFDVGAGLPVYAEPVTGKNLNRFMCVSAKNQEKISKKIKSNMFLASTKSQGTYADIDYTKYEEVFLLFGKETKGLPEDLIENNMKQAIRIPMKEGLRSLNLSNSVAIIVYEVLRQNNFNELQQNSQYFS